MRLSDLRPVLFVTGLVLSKLAIAMLIPLLAGVLYDEPTYVDFVYSALATQLCAFVFIYFGRKGSFHLSVKGAFMLTSIVWLAACVFAALPLWFYPKVSFTDAFFETMSGLTTTGSTVLSGLDHMPRCLLLWRSLLQWIGGIGFIVLSVAILPFLNVGGMRLFQTESSDWSEKSVPKTKQVAGNMLKVYVGLTLLCTVAYIACGMNGFEALNHAMTTLSTGGYSTSDESMLHFTTSSHWVASLFMLLGGLPFLLLVQAVRHKEPQMIWRDAQVRGFIGLILTVGTVMSLWLWNHDTFGFADAWRISIFNIISIVTTTGFGLGDFSHWGSFTTVLFIFLMLMGACSGSTSGGIKLFRFQLAYDLFVRQLKLLIHPRAVYPQRYNGRTIDDQLIRSLVAFLFAFFASLILLAGALALLGLDPTTALSGAITSLANVGPGLGRVIGPDHNFQLLPDSAKWLLSGGMLMGRLEILTIVVLFIPSYWRYR